MSASRSGGTSKPSSSSRSEYTTATGWRVVGKAASRMVRETAPGRTPLPVGRDEDVLFGSVFTVRPRRGAGSARNVILDALGDAVNAGRPDAARLLPDEPMYRPAGRFSGLEWDFFLHDGLWTGELVWRHPHPVRSGAPCTTQVIVEERKSFTRLAVRVTADQGVRSVRGMVGAGQARPEFLDRMRDSLEFVFDGVKCAPRPLDGRDIEDFVESVLEDEARRVPIVLLAPLEGEAGDSSPAYVVEPEVLAGELMGLAHLRVLPRHADTFVLSDTLRDRRLSCYWGALRIYMPGFARGDDPHEHPLLVRDRLVDPVMRAAEFGRLGAESGRRIEMPARVWARRIAASPPASHDGRSDDGAAPGPAPPAAADDGPRAARSETGAGIALPAARPATARGPAPADPDDPPALAADGTAKDRPTEDGIPPGRGTPTVESIVSSIPPELLGLGDRIAQLGGTIERLVAAQEQLLDEMKRLRTITALRSANTRSLERRLEGVEELLDAHLVPEDEREQRPSEADEASAALDLEAAEDDGRPSLVETVRTAMEAHPESLLFLDSAEASAAASPEEDVERVAVVLDAMAHVAEKRRDGALGTSLNDAFRDLGVDYRVGIAQSTPAKLREQYVFTQEGREYDCVEHIALGNSYDPRRCLRIYFTSRAPAETRFVIGHVGRHFRTMSTN